MWGGSGADPGGPQEEDTSGAPANQELLDLKDQFEQQQVLIAQLKEMLRKTEQTTVTQEKMEEYANTLTRISARTRKSKFKKQSQSDSKVEVSSKTIADTPAKERLMLLRQQVEENKQKLAERGKVKKGIEETVTQLKAQLDDSQQLISQTTLNLSLVEPRLENYSVNSSSEELYNLVLNKERKIAEMTAKVQKLEANIIDLQENVKEKDSVIDARTKAITLMTESLSKKSKNTLDTLDDTKEQMRHMQENFIKLENDMKIQKQHLLNQIEEKDKEIEHLLEENDDLKKSCSDKENQITQLSSELDKYKASAEPGSVTEAYEEKEIERGSPQRSSKRGKKGRLQKSKSKERDDSENVKELQKLLDNSKADNDKNLHKITELELMISELNLTVEELKKKPTVQPEAHETEEIQKLKKQLDDSNKSMIKNKAQHKSKIKELNKKLDELKKSAGIGEELAELQAENVKLNERIDMLEEEKANLGLDPTKSTFKDSSSPEKLKELQSQIEEESKILEQKTESIGLLEEKISSYKMEIERLKSEVEKLSNLKNAQVVSEMASINLEEQLDKLQMEKQTLIEEKESIKHENQQLLEKVDVLSKEKQEMSGKLDGYMQENMDLIDKLEKLSAEKVSSAESIEIVEALTQQEKLELEAYQKSLEMSENVKGSDENLQRTPELNESVNQLTEETSDLLRKIELFTEERREVMEKMETLTFENNQLNLKIQEVENNRDILAETYEQVQNEKEDLETQLDKKKEKIKNLESTLNGLKKENKSLREEVGRDKKDDNEGEESAFKEAAQDLQEQISEYRTLVEIQKQEIQELKLELLSQKDLSRANTDLHEKLDSLQSQYASLSTENEQLKKAVKESNEKVFEKDTLEAELKAAYKRLSEFDEKLTENFTEIENYRSIVEENKDELISSANIINDLQSKLQEKQNEIVHYESEVSHLNFVVAELNGAILHLEGENVNNKENSEAVEVMSNQLQELKCLLNENIKQIEEYETELHQNSDTISKLNVQLTELNRRILELENDLECKEDEIVKLIKERDNQEAMIVNLQKEIKNKDENFHRVCGELKEKCLKLQAKIEENAGSLENIRNPAAKVEELEKKNKEQLEKMKKIAANLKKKTAAYQELETKYNQSSEKWESKEKEKAQLQNVVKSQKSVIAESQQKIDSLLDQLCEVEKEFSAVQGTLASKTQEVENLKKENDELKLLRQNCEIQINAFRAEAEMHQSDESNALNTEISEKNEIIQNLRQQLENVRYNSEINSNALQAKIQEMEMFVETQESELVKYKDKVNKLEEGLSNVEERRSSLERKAIELGAQLQEKSYSYEEMSQTEDILEQRLAALMVHDEKIQRHLQETTSENQDLNERNRFLQEENDVLKRKLSEATERNLGLSGNEEKLEEIRGENIRLQESMAGVEHENRRLHSEYEKKLNEKQNEIETMEIELQGQLIQLDNERKTLLMQIEQMHDQVKEYTESQELLKQDVEQYKEKLEQQQIDTDASVRELHKTQVENQNYAIIIEDLNRQLNAIEVVDRDKIRVVEELLTEKDKEIENYKKLQHSSAEQNLPHLEENKIGLPESNVDLETHLQGNKSQEVSEPTPANVPIFVWPEQADSDPFAFITNTTQQTIEPVVVSTAASSLQAPAPNTSNDTDDLLQKIKTLQFMLFNSETEKEELLHQCQELTSEVARLIYKQSPQIGSEVCSEKDTIMTSADRAQLQSVEFTQVTDVADHSQPVVEESCVSQDTYLCYKDPPIQPHAEALASIDLQVLPPQDAQIRQPDMRQLQQLEYEKSKPCETVEPTKPCEERIPKPKVAYKCYQPVHLNESMQQPSTSHLEIFDENDDGWGCGVEEARLEENHQQQLTNTTLLEQLDERVRILEVERERHLEEIKQAQIKSGKLIKKLKEFKAVNERLAARLKNADFGGLDDAIQEELKAQVTQWEKKCKESGGELEKEKAEKANLLKKVDVLQAANERMVEMKEKQDVEVLSWQRQNRELKAKLEQLEWGDGGESPAKVPKIPGNSDGQSKVEELHNIIKELTLDNEELQAMLEEQRTLRISAEKAKSVEPMAENMKTEAEFLTVVVERDSLIEQLAYSVQEKKSLQEQLNNLIKSSDEVQDALQNLTQEKTQLENEVLQRNDTIERLNKEQKLTVQSSQAEQRLLQLEQDNAVLINQLQTIQQLNSHLQSENGSLLELKSVEDRLNREKNEIANELQDKISQIVSLKEVAAENEKRRLDLEEKLSFFDIVTQENLEIKENLKAKDSQIGELNKQFETALQERSTLVASLEQLAEEWSQRVDQRGADVAESWKLHMESRESEFLQIEQQLRKEINEFEEKCNALVNENNELRKNVDAEIRNEVDRVSALQQQINDKQQHVNELTRVVQESQIKIDQQQQKITEYEGSVKQLNGQMQEKNVRITEVEAKVLSLQIELEEKCKIIEELLYKLQTLESLQKELTLDQDMIANLQLEIKEKQAALETQALQLKQLEEYNDTIRSLENQIKEKDFYIAEIKGKLQEVQSHQERADVHSLQQENADLKLLLEENQNQIGNLTQEMYSYKQYCENFQEKEVELVHLRSQVSNLTALLNESHSNVQLQNSSNLELKQDLENKEVEIAVLQKETNNLKLLLSEKEREYEQNLLTTSQESETVFHEKAQELDALKRRLAEAEARHEESSLAREAGMEELWLQLQEHVQRNEMLVQENHGVINEFRSQLDVKELECEALQNKLQEQNALQDEENKLLTELREIIEDQVLKIEALKQELYEKSKDYDSLIAELDIRKPRTESPISATEEQQLLQPKSGSSPPSTPKDEDEAERAKRVELDLALYMLHQRDVRCEELTHELMQLLEERDTLQLKLSNAIREKEELRSRLSPDMPETADSKSAEGEETPKSKSKASAIVLGAMGAELAAEATEYMKSDRDHLANKLYELKSVGYKRDKTLLDEQDRRRMQELSLMQQHRDVAAMLPPEAAAQLVQDASYTLSRDVQSPPKVLLNWLWGRSTPRVNDI